MVEITENVSSITWASIRFVTSPWCCDGALLAKMYSLHIQYVSVLKGFIKMRNFVYSNWNLWLFLANIGNCLAFYSICETTLLAKKVVTPPLKTIKPMWIELFCLHLAEIGMIWTRDCSPTKSDTTLGRHSMQGQVGSSSPETKV